MYLSNGPKLVPSMNRKVFLRTGTFLAQHPTIHGALPRTIHDSVSRKVPALPSLQGSGGARTSQERSSRASAATVLPGKGTVAVFRVHVFRKGKGDARENRLLPEHPANRNPPIDWHSATGKHPKELAIYDDAHTGLPRLHITLPKEGRSGEAAESLRRIRFAWSKISPSPHDSATWNCEMSKPRSQTHRSR
jgi:hypothetical protein